MFIHNWTVVIKTIMIILALSCIIFLINYFTGTGPIKCDNGLTALIGLTPYLTIIIVITPRPETSSSRAHGIHQQQHGLVDEVIGTGTVRIA